MKLRAKERGCHIGIRVGDHRHHNETGYDVLHVAETVHLADSRANQITEDDEVQRHSDGGGNQSLHPNTGKPVNFFAEQTTKCRPINLIHAD
ncbi:Uncharacterised protein [Vibrio cholerae]|nr:Uncharacterised protein [Vibrio cholerae]